VGETGTPIKPAIVTAKATVVEKALPARSDRSVACPGISLSLSMCGWSSGKMPCNIMRSKGVRNRHRFNEYIRLFGSTHGTQPTAVGARHSDLDKSTQRSLLTKSGRFANTEWSTRRCLAVIWAIVGLLTGVGVLAIDDVQPNTASTGNGCKDRRVDKTCLGPD
jgi:hypothetical protein